MSSIVVAGLALTPVKGMRLQSVEQVEATEPLPFGIYGEVVREGTVRVGDAVSVAQ